MPEKKEKNLEDLFTELEDLIEKLENPEVSLEESFQYYEEGMRKLKVCSSRIEGIEKKLQILQEDGRVGEE